MTVGAEVETADTLGGRAAHRRSGRAVDDFNADLDCAALQRSAMPNELVTKQKKTFELNSRSASRGHVTGLMNGGPFGKAVPNTFRLMFSVSLLISTSIWQGRKNRNDEVICRAADQQMS